MPRKQLLTWFVGCLSGIALLTIGSCGHGPLVTVYISDPSREGMEFYNEKTGATGFVEYSQTDKFVCLNQVDMQAYLNYCGGKK